MREITKAKILSSLRVPIFVFSRFCKKYLYNAQIKRMRELTREAPLYLEIETTNICNSSCIFCSYPGMKRKKGVMSLQMFQKVIADYVRMGGGPISLTPMEGEPLLDPHLKERLDILKKYPETQQVILTTNGIALNKFADQEIYSLLENLYLIRFSLGGLDAATYKFMFNVDRFSQVMNDLNRLLKIREEVPEPAHIVFAFRTNDPNFEVRFKSQLDGYRKMGVDISHIHAFTNNCVALKSDEEDRFVVLRNTSRKHLTCVFPCMSMVVSWDGIVTACCENSEDADLRIGHVEKETLTEIWAGQRRQRFLSSFSNRKPFPVCLKCSAYQTDAFFADPCFKDLQPHQTFPKNFIQFK